MNLEIGTVLIAKDVCAMKNGINTNALIIGKEYPIKAINGNEIVIESEISENHFFETEDGEARNYINYFDVKQL